MEATTQKVTYLEATYVCVGDVLTDSDEVVMNGNAKVKRIEWDTEEIGGCDESEIRFIFGPSNHLTVSPETIIGVVG